MVGGLNFVWCDDQALEDLFLALYVIAENKNALSSMVSVRVEDGPRYCNRRIFCIFMNGGWRGWIPSGFIIF